MGTVKHKKSETKISKIRLESDICSDVPFFSFRYLTKNKDYNFDKLDNNEKKEWALALMNRIKEISQYSWVHWHNQPKNQGIETIPYKEIKFSPNGYVPSKDEKVIVFRFRSQDGRIIGVKESNCSVFYIIGFDTKYSAYKHE